jgi:methyltransferase (TIGR00027 family)
LEQKTGKRMGPSQTAQLAAAHRAYHLMRDRPTILEDSAAIWLLGPPLSVVLRMAPLRWLFWERLLVRVRPVSVFVVLRSRYAEDRLERSISDGCRQYVILGAGLDSWALRQETPVVTVFELDHPATQQWKEARIRARLGTVPSHLTLIPIDFERQTIADALSGQQFDRDSLAFVSWLGTTYYLTRSAIEATLASLARICAPGSRVVFDYFQPKSMMSPADLRLFEGINRHATRRGEPLLTLLGSDDVLGMMQSTGYRLVEDLSASEARRRYLHLRSDGLDIPGFVRLCCAEVAAQPNKFYQEI